MERKRLLLIACITILMLVLTSACVRPASTPPPQTTANATTEGQSFPVPGTTDDVMSQLEKAATQTLMAMQGTPQVLPTNPIVIGTVTGGETPVVEVPTVAAPTTGAEVQPTAIPQVAAPTTTPIAVPTATPGRPSSWTLQTGEFPFCIARRFDVNPTELLQLNGLGTNTIVHAGMVLRIPQTGNTFPGSRSLKSRPTNYTVASGDNIYSIACQFGDADPFAIAAANGLASPYRIDAGQNLYIP